MSRLTPPSLPLGYALYFICLSIHKYASCSKECFILALIYIDRLIQKNNFLLTELNVHRVVITAVLLAAKFFDDAYYNNAYYAKVGGVLVSEMNALECEFLFKIDFSLRVVPEVFEKYKAELISHSSALGLSQISNCSDEELFERVGARRQQEQERRQQVQQQQVQQVADAHQYQPLNAPAPVAIVAQTYSTELNPVVYGSNLTPVAAPQAQEGCAAVSHYPIQALHQSMTQLQVTDQQQSNATVSAIDPGVFPFPNLANQVSVQHHAQDPPAQNPSELDLVYYNAAPAASGVAPAPQDVSVSQYSNQVLQSQAYPQQQGIKHADPIYQNNFATPMAAPSIQITAAPTAQAPVYSQHTNYFTSNGAVATVRHSHPEITPSPPPQPPINIAHRAPIPMGGCSAQHVNLANTVAYLNSTSTAAANALHTHHRYPQQHLPFPGAPADASLDYHPRPQLLPSRPIAIPHHVSRENSGTWPFHRAIASSPA